MIRTSLLALALLALGLTVAGCGSDSSGESTASVSVPTVTAPTVSTGVSTTPGKVKTTKGGKTVNPSAPDSSTNDVPPPKGSPQAAFEQQCKVRPSVCR